VDIEVSRVRRRRRISELLLGVEQLSNPDRQTAVEDR
jgi:hypothetical protein